MSRTILLILGLMLTSAACTFDGDAATDATKVSTAAEFNDPPDPATTTSTTAIETGDSTIAPSTSLPDAGPADGDAEPEIPPLLSDLETAMVRVNGVELFVVLATTPSERSQGLMGVEDLGTLDGMLFLWGQDTTGPFWMFETVIALDITWFDGDGIVVSSESMVPCRPDTTCERYRAAAPYRYALEVPAGGLAALEPLLQLDLGFVP